MLKSAWQHAWLIIQNITPPSLWQHCIHLHGNIVTVRAGIVNGGKIVYRMDRFVVNFDLFGGLSLDEWLEEDEKEDEKNHWFCFSY